jgi:hypothetical protein
VWGVPHFHFFPNGSGVLPGRTRMRSGIQQNHYGEVLAPVDAAKMFQISA